MEELPDHAGGSDAESDVEPLEITTLPSARRLPVPRSSRRILSGVVILAAVLVVALFASLFRYHIGDSPSSPGGATFTQTTLEGISMVSPNVGWMVGNVVTFRIKTAPTATPDTGVSSNHTTLTLTGLDVVNVSMLLYHDQSGAWTRVPVSVPGGTPHLSAISMDSPTDGWAVGGGPGTAPTSANAPAHCFLLHYTGRAWLPLSLPLAGMLTSVRMVAPNDGWAVGTSEGTAQRLPLILHYDGSAWTQQALPAGLGQSNGTQQNISLPGLAALPTGDAWVMLTQFPHGTIISDGSGSSSTGVTTVTSTAPGPQYLPSTVILHSSGGPWTVQATLPGMVLSGFDMASPESGWAVGSDVGAPPAHITSAAALNSPQFLRYAGGAWTPGPTKVLSDESHQLTMSSLTLLSPTDGWAVGISQSAQSFVSTPDSGPPPVPPPVPPPLPPPLLVPPETMALAHFDGTTWVPIKGPPLPSGTLAVLSGASFSAPNDVWIVGTLLTPNGPGYNSNAPLSARTAPLLLHYASGVWSTVDLQV